MESNCVICCITLAKKSPLLPRRPGVGALPVEAALLVRGPVATPGARPGICLVAGVLTLGFSSLVLFPGPGLVLLFKSMTDMWWALSLTKMYPEVCLAYGGGGSCVSGEGRSRGTAGLPRGRSQFPTATSCVAWCTSPITCPTPFSSSGKQG